MIIELNTKHGIEVWINQKLVEEIELSFEKLLKTDDLFYYYIPCQCHRKKDKKQDNTIRRDVKWIGKVSLIDFIKKVQYLNHHFCPIGVTNAKNKKDLLFYIDHHFNKLSDEVTIWDYWIGDVVKENLVCGDELFIELWNRILNQKTKNSITRKEYFKMK
jgi:hypothetical protein